MNDPQSIINSQHPKLFTFNEINSSSTDLNVPPTNRLSSNIPEILTPSQEVIAENCIKLLSEFKLIVIKGESLSGKNLIAKEIFRRTNALVEYFDLCELAQLVTSDSPIPLSNQHVRDYMETLLKRHISQTQGKSQSKLGIIYFRYYNRIVDSICDIYNPLRFLLSLTLKTFIDSMPPNIRIIITTQICCIPEGLHWCMELNTTRQDMEHILKIYQDRNIITVNEKVNILKICKITPVGRILYCLKYAMAISDKPESFIDNYRKAYSKFSGSTVDVEKDVPKPIPEDDLVGVEEIIDAITVSIINPMKLGIHNIPIKKGLLLCGPPGTGKTSIGRWLAHQIRGKFYLIGGEAGINGASLIDTFERNMKKARDNAPAVVFIDDGDLLFERDEIYRAFLTILDGIETNKRNDVCVILTCMNLKNIPSSLLRGGRLEMALITRLPDRRKIQIILQRSLDKMCQTLIDYNETLGKGISTLVTKDLIKSLSFKMSGWNCADINRCVNDVLRMLISKKDNNVTEMFQHCIDQIREQYSLCGKCESTNIDERIYDSYMI